MSHSTQRMKTGGWIWILVVWVGGILIYKGIREDIYWNWFMPTERAEELVSRETIEYLSSRYQDEFNITGISWLSRGGSPVPTLETFQRGRTLVIAVESDRFPGEVFEVRYERDERKNSTRGLSDNYYTLLLREDAQEYFAGYLNPYLDDVEYFIKIFWSVTGWPEGIGADSTIREWLEAGGKLYGVRIYLKAFVPTDELCKSPAMEILQQNPTVDDVTFIGVTPEGYEYRIKNGNDNLHQWPDEWLLGTLQYDNYTE